MLLPRGKMPNDVFSCSFVYETIIIIVKLPLISFPVVSGDFWNIKQFPA